MALKVLLASLGFAHLCGYASSLDCLFFAGGKRPGFTDEMRQSLEVLYEQKRNSVEIDLRDGYQNSQIMYDKALERIADANLGFEPIRPINILDGEFAVIVLARWQGKEVTLKVYRTKDSDGSYRRQQSDARKLRENRRKGQHVVEVFAVFPSIGITVMEHFRGVQWLSIEGNQRVLGRDYPIIRDWVFDRLAGEDLDAQMNFGGNLLVDIDRGFVVQVDTY